MKRVKRIPKQWRVSYHLKHGRKLYSFISVGSTGRAAFANWEKTFPGATANMVYVSARRNIVKPVGGS